MQLGKALLTDFIKNIKNYLKLYIPLDFLNVFSFDILSKVFMAVMSILIIRLLSIEDYAIYVKFLSISSLVFSILGQGLSVAFVRFATERISRGNNDIHRLFIIFNVFIVGLTISAMITIPLLKNAYNITTFLSIMSLSYGGSLALNRMNQSYFQAKEKFTLSGIITNLRNIVLFLCLLFAYFLWKNVNVNIISLITIISTMAAFLLGVFWIKRDNTSITIEKFSQNTIKDVIHESSWLIIYCILVALFDQVSILIMSKISSDTTIAVFGVATRYYFLMLTLLASMNTILRIRTSKSDMVDSQFARIQFTKDWIKKTWRISALICLFAIFGSGFIFPLLNGHDYDSAITTFRILMIGVFISYVFAPNVSVMMSAKKHKLLCLLAFIAFLVNIIVCFTLIPIWGANAAAIAVVLSNAILNVSSTVFILKSKSKK